jgi:DNA-binding CsgD family transcriptional regulator
VLERSCTQALSRLRSSPGEAIGSFNVFVLQAIALGVTERFEEALRLIEEVGSQLRPSGILWSSIGLRIARVAILLNQGNALGAVIATDDLGEEIDLDRLNHPRLFLLRAQAFLLLGRISEAEKAYHLAEGRPGAGSWFAAVSRAVFHGQRLLSEARPSEALDAFWEARPSLDRVDVGSLGSPRWACGTLEAAVRSGRQDAAEQLVAWLDARAGRLPCTWPEALAATGRAGLAAARGDPKADALYQQAMALPASSPLQSARTELAYGSYLRRHHASLRARPLLREAARVAEELGATGMAQRASEELWAAGGRRRPRAGRAQLTGQELRVAEEAITGATAREIAASLYLSPRTVETHLASAYRKLGVASKAELRRRRHELAISPPVNRAG